MLYKYFCISNYITVQYIVIEAWKQGSDLYMLGNPFTNVITVYMGYFKSNLQLDMQQGSWTFIYFFHRPKILMNMWPGCWSIQQG